MRTIFSHLFLAITAGTFFSSCAGPESLLRAHAYDGARKSAPEMATVFAVWNGLAGEMVFICEVDGKSYQRMGKISNCPSVVYVLPGKHELSLRYNFANYSGTVTVPVDAEGGHTYRVAATSYDLKEAHFVIEDMPADFKLTYKDVAPAYFTTGSLPNSYVDPLTAK